MDPSSGVQVQQHQEMSSYPVENMLVCPKIQQQDKKSKPQPEEALKCPRCDSTNTKFCYYNNYSLSQPRYFCKSCRRYWTKGGTLRNVPVGGGCRKNKRSLLSSSSKFRANQDPIQSLTPNGNSFLNGIFPSNLSYEYETNDHTLAIIQKLQKLQHSGQLGFDSDHHGDFNMMGNSSTSTNNHYDFPSTHDAIQVNNNSTETLGLLGSLRSSKFLDTQGHFQNLCHGLGDEANTQIENGGGTATTMVKKQDLCVGRENENRVLWGCPWNNGDVGMMDVISGRGSNWSNVVGSSWQGLLNSPLM